MTTDDLKCRVCGCTNADCSQCISRTGKPCHWVTEDLCSACASGFNTIIKVKRGNVYEASVRVGGRNLRASATGGEFLACERVAQKACELVKANAWRVERYATLSIKAGRAALFLEFDGEKQ
jgi:hypothetical protein